MTKWDKIIVNGETTDSCPMWDCRTREPFLGGKGESLISFCKLNKKIRCRYGLTEISVPKKCPLKRGVHTIKMVLALQD